MLTWFWYCATESSWYLAVVRSEHSCIKVSFVTHLILLSASLPLCDTFVVICFLLLFCPWLGPPPIATSQPGRIHHRRFLPLLLYPLPCSWVFTRLNFPINFVFFPFFSIDESCWLNCLASWTTWTVVTTAMFLWPQPLYFSVSLSCWFLSTISPTIMVNFISWGNHVPSRFSLLLSFLSLVAWTILSFFPARNTRVYCLYCIYSTQSPAFLLIHPAHLPDFRFPLVLSALSLTLSQRNVLCTFTFRVLSLHFHPRPLFLSILFCLQNRGCSSGHWWFLLPQICEHFSPHLFYQPISTLVEWGKWEKTRTFIRY